MGSADGRQSSGSYTPADELRGTDSEIERLRLQAELTWEAEARVLQRMGMRDGIELLEIGCGPGFVTRKLTQMLEASTITALDPDPAMIARAAALLGAMTEDRVRLVGAPIEASGLPHNSFDFALARYVFQHLEDPTATAAAVMELLRPGGTVAVIDVDVELWGIAEPAHPEVQAIYAKAARAYAGRGRDQLVGRRLWRILAAAGFENLQLDAFVAHSDAAGVDAFAFHMDPDRLRPLAAEGIISAEELDVLRRATQSFLAAPDAYVLTIGLVVSGSAP